MVRVGNRERSNETTTGREGNMKKGKPKQKRRKKIREREVISTLKNLNKQYAFKLLLENST